MEIVLKLDESGNAVLDENKNPVYIFTDKDGTKEEGVDVVQMFGKISSVNKESMDRRLKLKEYESTIQTLANHGIEQDKLEEFIETSKSNSQKVQNFSEKDMKSAEEVEKIKKGVSESYDNKIKELNLVLETVKVSSQKELSTKEQTIRNLLIKGAFNKSDFIKDKTVLIPDIAFNTFGKFFQVEERENDDPVVYALDSKGEKIFSKTKPGEYADPEESIEILIKGHPQADAIMRASDGGDNHGKPHVFHGNRKISSEQLQNMSPTERLNYGHSQKK